MKTVIQIILLAAIIGLAYLLVISIFTPISFEKEKEIRYDVTIQRLKDIRIAQLAYKSVNQKFAGSFDTLIEFIKKDSLREIKAIGHVPDTMTEANAVKLGFVKRDTNLVSTLDSLFPPPYPIDSLMFVPYTNGAKFKLGATIFMTGSKVKVPVFEAKVLNKVLLHGLDNQLRINLDDESINIGKYPGLKVGSLIEATNNAGNWE